MSATSLRRWMKQRKEAGAWDRQMACDIRERQAALFDAYPVGTHLHHCGVRLLVVGHQHYDAPVYTPGVPPYRGQPTRLVCEYIDAFGEILSKKVSPTQAAGLSIATDREETHEPIDSKDRPARQGR